MSETPERPMQRRGGRVRGAEGYHKEDVSALLKCVRTVLPTTPEDWDHVLDQYRRTHAIPNTRSQRDANSLKVKFKQLARNYKPGVEGRPDVEEAGEIMDLIEGKMTDGNWVQRRGGRARGAEGFSSADSQTILSIVRRFLPVQRSDWEQVAEEYCREYAVPNERITRDGISLKNKFRNWLKDDTDNMPRSEVIEAVAVQAEIFAKVKEEAKKLASLEHEKKETIVDSSAEDVKEQSGGETKVNITEMVNEHEKSATSSEAEDKIPIRRGGRTLGSEGYTKADTRALLACVRQVLPSGPTSWQHVLQLYRVNHAIPNERSQRNHTGIKIKFKQLVNWKQDPTGRKQVPDEVLEARAIRREIDLDGGQGKHPHSESGSNPHTPEGKTQDGREEHSLLLPHTEVRNNENVERQNVVADAAVWSMSSQVSVDGPVVKRQKQDHGMGEQQDADSESVRHEIASRELELLRRREQREAEQAAWEKERTLREKQRMDMEAWTFVCDRLRALYREQATEKKPEIVNEIEEEIAVLRKKKQRLANLMA